MSMKSQNIKPFTLNWGLSRIKPLLNWIDSLQRRLWRRNFSLSSWM